MGDCTETLGGSFDYVSYSAWIQGKPLFSSAFKVATDTKRGAVAMGLASNLVALFPVKYTGDPNCPSNNWISASMAELDGWDDFPADQTDYPKTYRLPAIPITLDKSFTIPAVSRTYTSDDWDYIEGGPISLSWPAAAAKSPPRDDDDSGK